MHDDQQPLTALPNKTSTLSQQLPTTCALQVEDAIATAKAATAFYTMPAPLREARERSVPDLFEACRPMTDIKPVLAKLLKHADQQHLIGVMLYPGRVSSGQHS